MPAGDRHGRHISLTPERLERMRRFVHRYGSFGVFIARFVIGLRFMAGPLAGSLGLPPPTFFLANVLGALCYVPIMVGAGYAVEYGFRWYVKRFLRTEDTLEMALLFGAILLGLLFLAYQAVQHLRRRKT